MLLLGDNSTRVTLLAETGQLRLERGCYYALHPLFLGLDMRLVIAAGLLVSLTTETVKTGCPGGGSASQASMGQTYWTWVLAQRLAHQVSQSPEGLHLEDAQPIAFDQPTWFVQY